MNVIATLEKLHKFFGILVGLTLLCVVGLLDYLTGYELSFSLFYLFPIAVITWFVNGTAGGITAFVSAGLWLTIDILTGVHYSSPIIYIWNAAIRLGFFLLMVLSLRLGKKLERETTFARTDYITGALNARFFHNLVQREIDRSARYGYPMTIAYIDIDNFKIINDMFGHLKGDNILRAVADGMQRHVRKIDIVARVGGDEFAILLPEVGPDAAQIIISRMQHRLLETV